MIRDLQTAITPCLYVNTMPPAKRIKSSADSSRAQSSANRSDSDAEGEFASLAKQHWLKKTKRATKVKVKNDVLKREIWDALEKDGFQFKSLVALEGLQTLERYVMPVYLLFQPRELRLTRAAPVTFGRDTARTHPTSTYC